MGKWQALVLAALTLSGCSKSGSQDPVAFLPKQVAADGTDLEARRLRYCHGQNVSLDGDLLTPSNFRAVFDCANYDGSLATMGPLLTSEKFPDFIKNVNLILESDGAKDVKETLRDWIEEGQDGASRADRLLPVVASVIKNPSFQDALPLISSILGAGENIWEQLMPSLAEVLYQERFPDNFDDIFTLFKNNDTKAQDKNYAKTVKDWSAFLQSDVRGGSVAMRALELADGLRSIKMSGTSPQEYLDQMNEKGVFVSLFLESGAVRGEQLDPKLNAQPDRGDNEDGLKLTPEQRRIRNHKKLFARGAKDELPPIMRLIGLVDEFQKDHSDFVPALGRWFATEKAKNKITDSLSRYVVNAQVVSGLPAITVSDYLNDYADGKEINTDEPMTPEEFVAFLKNAFAEPKFADFLAPLILELNNSKLGPKNAKILSGSTLAANVAAVYAQQAVANYGAEIYKLAPAPKNLSAAIRKFSNTHRALPLSFDLNGATGTVQDHMLNAWWAAANETMGESVVLDFAFPLVQTLVSKVTADFGKNGKTVSEWYFSSPYTDPSTTETISAYAFQDLDLLDKYNKNLDYLMGELPNEIFKGGKSPEQDEANKRAFRALVSEIPTIWTYWKSGMSRSGNDLTRALSSKDKGYLIKNYVAVLVSAYQTGFAEKAVDLLAAYQNAFPASFESAEVSDSLEDRRKVSLGADALKRVLRSLFRPEATAKYETSTLGRLLVPLSDLVGESQRATTERFLLTSAKEIQDTSDEKLNDFFNDFGENAKPQKSNIGSRRETLRAVSDAMKKEKFPATMRQVSSFFQDNAVKPALDYLRTRIEDGSLKSVLQFLRRVLGFRG